MNIETPQEVRDYLSKIGSIKTAKKAESSRANAEKATAARLNTAPCKCGREDVADPLKHKSTCNRYQAEKQRLRRLAKKREDEATE